MLLFFVLMLLNMNTEFGGGFWVGSFYQCSVVIQHLILIVKIFKKLQKCCLEIFLSFHNPRKEFGKNISEH